MVPVVLVPVVLVTVAVVAVAVFLSPRLLEVDDDEVGRVDVVVALGGRAERAVRAAELAAEFQVPLVLSADSIWHGTELGIEPGPSVHALRPVPVTTAGEARALRGLTTTMGWEHVLVVTSNFHRRRARLLLRWSLGDRVRVVGASALGVRPRPVAALRELLGIAHALAWERPASRRAARRDDRRGRCATRPR